MYVAYVCMLVMYVGCIVLHCIVLYEPEVKCVHFVWYCETCNEIVTVDTTRRLSLVVTEQVESSNISTLVILAQACGVFCCHTSHGTLNYVYL